MTSGCGPAPGARTDAGCFLLTQMACLSCGMSPQKPAWPRWQATPKRQRVAPAVPSPDGRTLLSSSSDNTLKLWDVTTLSCKATLIGHNGCVNGCAWRPDGTAIASASEDGTLKLWSAAAPFTCTATMNCDSGSLTACVWSPDGRYLVSCSYDANPGLWDVDAGSCVARLVGHAASVRTCAWSPDGLSLATGDAMGTAKLWDVHY